MAGEIGVQSNLEAFDKNNQGDNLREDFPSHHSATQKEPEADFKKNRVRVYV